MLQKVFDCGYNCVGDSYEKQVAELRPSIFLKGLLACLKEPGTSLDHPTWTTTAPPVELPDSLAIYSPIILSGFNEEEYANQPVEEEDGADSIVTPHNELGELEVKERGLGELKEKVLNKGTHRKRFSFLCFF